MFNKIILVGNVGKDVELTHFKAGDETVAKATTSIATSEKRGGKEETTWHSVEVIGKRAEAFAKYTKKGSKILVEGKQTHRSYEKDGKQMYFSSIRVSEFCWLSNRNEQEGNTATADASSDIPF